MRSQSLGLTLLTLSLLGCATEPPTFEALAGTYTGSFVATEPGGAQFDGVMELVLSQTEESLTGSWEIVGVISGTGTVNTTTDGGASGTLPLGPNPSFDMQLAYSFCPQDLMTFVASFNSSTGTLTLVGDLDIPTSMCNVLTAYPLSFSLSR